MKRVGNRSSEDFPAATLYLDDLEEIITILAERCERIEINAGDYMIKGKDELEALAQKFIGRFEHIRLQGYGPYMSINIETYGVRTYISEDSIEQRGIVARVGDVINKGKKKNPAWLYGALTNVLAFTGAVLVLKKEYAIGAAMVSAAILLIPTIVKASMRNKVVVHTSRRSHTTSFLERRKDDLGIAAISAILGGFITYLVTKFIS